MKGQHSPGKCHLHEEIRLCQSSTTLQPEASLSNILSYSKPTSRRRKPQDWMQSLGRKTKKTHNLVRTSVAMRKILESAVSSFCRTLTRRLQIVKTRSQGSRIAQAQRLRQAYQAHLRASREIQDVSAQASDQVDPPRPRMHSAVQEGKMYEGPRLDR